MKLVDGEKLGKAIKDSGETREYWCMKFKCSISTLRTMLKGIPPVQETIDRVCEVMGWQENEFVFEVKRRA